MELDFETFDEVAKMERVINALIETFGLSNNYIALKTQEQQTIYVLTIISILYKEKCYEEYLGEKINGNPDDIAINIIYEIIDELKQKLEEKEFGQITKYIKNNGSIIQYFLERHFNKKNTNYITERHSMDIIKNQKNQKELLKYNPFCINQILEYEQNPLTEQELIIEEITEFLVESQQQFTKQNDILMNIKQIMLKQYTPEKLDDVISFMISNTYQEIIENPMDDNKNTIVSIVENTKISPKLIIQHFINSNYFSNMILKTFMTYNLNIEKGRLEELETKESKKYAKRIYRKNP